MQKRLLWVLSVGALSAAFISPSIAADEFGHFEGELLVKFMDNGRDVRLLQPYSYIDPAQRRWTAPKGFVSDGASIPKWAWSFVGGPLDDKYRNAAVIHDVGCVERKQKWEIVHLTFYNAMRAAGVSESLAKVMYAAVYHFGPRWTVTTLPKKYSSLGEALAYQSKATEEFRAYIQPGIQVSSAARQVAGDGTFANLPHPYYQLDVTIASPATQADEPPAEFAALKESIEKTDASLAQIRSFDLNAARAGQH
ncbi:MULTISPECIES: DUF1353 domain-containing protein [Ralstonia]|jgi:hypothetical protein|uniref:DUF1353 domain-containing protein n=1 Tax=Ralstonia flaminis TaxID=3058597 RepID=A0ABM9K0R9_9RALS|nr:MULTISPECIES: DUF1353 domain-containing protein [unclassified Ralstonia]CAJ0810702.1 hypothetical protein LMG18101_00967 [Ralstonia sp. LMG 18101]